MNFKPFNSQTTTFFDNSFIAGFNLLPDAKHSALRQALLDYYQTYHSLQGNFYTYIEKFPNGTIELSQATGHDFLTKYFSSITFVQLFIEVYVKEILEKIDPILCTANLNRNKERDFIDYIKANDFTHFERLSAGRTIQFKVALSRLIKLINSDALLPNQFKVDTKYHFFIDNEKMLESLAQFRNSIIHKGNEIMSKYSFELLFINYIIPFITTLLRLENREAVLERNLFCKKNILDELCSLELNIDYKEPSKFVALQKTLRHINHLKELGRASFHNTLQMGENSTQAHQDTLHNKKIKIQHEQEAQQTPDYNDCPCPCCGTKSLIVLSTSTSCSNGEIRAVTVSCSVCSYYVNKELGEPMEFDLSDQEIFPLLSK